MASGPGSAMRQPGTAEAKTFANTVQKLLGTTGLKFSTMLHGNLDRRAGYARSTTGLVEAIDGSASVIASTVAMGLLESQDPIKAILSTEVHQQERIIITRKYVVGGGADITPERAPARTVSIREDVREVFMARYGGDIEMNLNLFLQPELAKTELDLKMGAQTLMLENKLIELGYEAVMDDSTNVVDAIMRSNPAYSHVSRSGSGSQTAIIASQSFDVRLAADRVYCTQVFGALSKHTYAVPNLLAAVKYASAYTLGSIQNPVVILPHAAPGLLKYTRPESLKYSVTGVPAAGNRALSMELERSFTDPVTGANIMVHYPRPSYDSGSVRPTVDHGGLSGETTVHMYYCLDGRTVGGEFFIPDALHGGFKKLDNSSGEKYFIRTVKCSMSSAIVAAPGGRAGRLLVGYPMTGVSTSTATEAARIQLRMYMGAAVTNPDEIFVLPNVAFEGIISDEVNKNWDPSDKDNLKLGKPFDKTKNNDAPGLDDFETAIVHHGALYQRINGKIERIEENRGHFGKLDSPDAYSKLWGSHVYDGDEGGSCA